MTGSFIVDLQAITTLQRNWLPCLQANYTKKALAFASAFLMKTNPNFNTNAPLFEVRGCKVILGGAFLSQGVQNGFRGVQN